MQHLEYACQARLFLKTRAYCCLDELTLSSGAACIRHDDLCCFRHAELTLARIRIPACSLRHPRYGPALVFLAPSFVTLQNALVFCALMGQSGLATRIRIAYGNPINCLCVHCPSSVIRLGLGAARLVTMRLHSVASRTDSPADGNLEPAGLRLSWSLTSRLTAWLRSYRAILPGLELKQREYARQKALSKPMETQKSEGRRKPSFSCALDLIELRVCGGRTLLA